MTGRRETLAALGITAIQKLRGFTPEQVDKEGLPKVEIDEKSSVAHYVFFNKSEAPAKLAVAAGGKRIELELEPREKWSMRGDLTDQEEMGIMTILHQSTITLTVMRPGGKVRHFEAIAPTTYSEKWDRSKRAWVKQGEPDGS